MTRFLLFLLALLSVATPARADDISVAGRSVVRVVVIAFEDGEPADFGHGSGFAVAANRVVTNAHVIAPAAQYPGSVVVGVVPSQGSKSYAARILAIDQARDLALLEVEQGSIPALPLYVGPLDDGEQIAALGYPGNVDLATARSASDYITPLPPTRSVGVFSNIRTINGITTLLHTANIARGHSGGPLLDQCGRVVGVNTLITRNEDGDAPFAFAVANRELSAFLREARQPFQPIASECVGMAERLRQDQDRLEAEERARQAAAAQRERQLADARERALAQVDESRESRLALAVLLLILSLLAFGTAGIMMVKDRPKPVIPLAAAGAVLLIGAVVVFLTRPSRNDVEVELQSNQAAAEAVPRRFVGRNTCRLVPERSRVTVTAADDVPFEWSETGCVNGRTQYAPNGEVWTRVLAPASEPAVSVLQFRPATGEYVVSRYQLDAESAARARTLRGGEETRSCTAGEEARTQLAERQRQIAELLPQLPNERLVYQCERAAAAS